MVHAWYSVSAFAAAAIAGGLAYWLYRKRHAASYHQSLAALLVAISLAHIANGLGLLDEAHGIFWRRLALASELLQPAAMFYAGMRFINPMDREVGPFRLWIAHIMASIGLLLALLSMTDRVVAAATLEDGTLVIGLAPWGAVPYVFVILAMALGLAQLELVLRASSEPVRYRLKLMVIGLGGLAGYQIYQASQMLLLPTWRPDQIVVLSSATIISLSVLRLGIARSRWQALFVNAYVSQQALLGSVTFIVIGIYLLVVGVIGEWLRRIQQPLGAEFNIILMFAALLALAIAAYSKSIRAEVRRYLSRNFYRSIYDYRAEWLRVTEAFQHAASRDAILDQLLDLLIRTFSTTTIAIWVFRDADRRFVRARPVVGRQDLLELSHPIIVELLKQDEPVMPDPAASGSVDPLTASGAVLCFPVHVQRRLVAFIALGPQLRGEPYGTDDCDLLRGICRHVGALLAHTELAEERRASAELEALHRFSVFCLHDLKNLASRLSLMAQNAEQHGRDPAFQESVMRTVADTAEKMTSLMTKLSLKSVQPTLVGEAELIDIPILLKEVLAPLRQDRLVQFTVTDTPVPLVRGVREQLYQALLNLVLNARHAIREQGYVSIVLEQSDKCVIITIQDTGHGIPLNKFDTLFQPSQTGRPGGLGVGLYQCKRIIEAHGGTIQLRSEVGQGTQVQIELPLPTESGACAVAAQSIVSS